MNPADRKSATMRFGKLVLYIRHLPPKGSLGEPQVYGGSGCPGPTVLSEDANW